MLPHIGITTHFRQRLAERAPEFSSEEIAAALADHLAGLPPKDVAIEKCLSAEPNARHKNRSTFYRVKRKDDICYAVVADLTLITAISRADYSAFKKSVRANASIARVLAEKNAEECRKNGYHRDMRIKRGRQ